MFSFSFYYLFHLRDRTREVVINYVSAAYLVQARCSRTANVTQIYANNHSGMIFWSHHLLLCSLYIYLFVRVTTYSSTSCIIYKTHTFRQTHHTNSTYFIAEWTSNNWVLGIITHPVSSEHRWLVKAPRGIHSVPDFPGRRSWRCGRHARLWNLHDFINTSRL